MSFAKVTIIGNLGRDPEVRTTPNGAKNVSFTIAASGRRRRSDQQDQDNTTWFRVTAWGENADRLERVVQQGYVAKGRLLYVEGQLEQQQFTGNDGQQRTSLEVTLSDWQFVGSRQDGQGGGSQQGGYQNQQGGQADYGNQNSYGGQNYGGNSYGSGSSDNFDTEDPSGMDDVPF